MSEFLTEAQIKSILRDVPATPGVGKTAKAIARRHLVSRLETVLRTIKLVPTEAAFKEFSEAVIASLYESYIEPGSPVGVKAGVALGGPTTQISLNSFHFAGSSSGVATEFQKLRDAMTGSKLNRNPEMRIFFRSVNYDYPGSDLHDTLHRGTFESIMAERPRLEQTTVSDLVVENGVRILNREEAVALGVESIIDLQAEISSTRFVNRANRFPLTAVMELTLNTYRMYTHRITMGMVAKAIEGPSTTDMLTVVWRSQEEGKIYILADETKDLDTELGHVVVPEVNSLVLFFSRELRQNLDKLEVTGVMGILSVEPKEIDVLDGIHHVTTRGSHHAVYTNNTMTRWIGVSLADIHNMLSVCGFTVGPIRDVNKERLYVDVDFGTNERLTRMKERVERLPQKTPLQTRVLESDTVPLLDMITFMVRSARQLDEEEDRAIIDAAAFSYVVAVGNNTEALAWRNDIDHFRTISESSHSVFELFGIDAAMIFMIFRFRQILEDFKSFINPRHISLFFGLLCNLGIINSLSFAGVSRRKIGPLAMSSYERAYDVFTSGSIFGAHEVPAGVSSSIFLGQKSKRIGTGSIGIQQDLLAVPVDTTALPSIDEEDLFADYTPGEELMGEEPADLFEEFVFDEGETTTPTAPVPFTMPPSVGIRESAPDREPEIEPAGAYMVTPSDTLMSAMRKVTTGTPISVEPLFQTPQIGIEATEVTDITELDSLDGLELLGEQEVFTPATPRTFDDLPTVPSSPTIRVTQPSRSIREEDALPTFMRSPEIPVRPRVTPEPVALPSRQTSAEEQFLSLLPDISEFDAQDAQPTARISTSSLLRQRQNQ